MFIRLLRPQIIKRFCHTHSKTVIKENKKSTDELLIEQLTDMNMNLHKIWECGQTMKLSMICLGVIILAKPMK
jgi:hypothetical protein